MRRIRLRVVAVVSAIGLVAVACGDTGSVTEPTPGAAASTATATTQPTTTGAPTTTAGPSTTGVPTTSEPTTTTTTVAASSTTLPATITTTTEPAPAQLPVLGCGDELQRALDDIADKTLGYSVAVRVPGREPWTGVAGVSEPGVPVTTDMAFGVGSVTKNFVAALVLQLAEEGKLSLDDRLNEWIRAWPNVDGTATIRQLLNHTSGLYSLDEHPDFGRRVFVNPHWWTDEALLNSFQEEPYSAPGAGWRYSNTGYVLLGQIIEEVTGSSVSAELRDRFLAPLGMSTAFYLTAETPPGEVAEGWFELTTPKEGLETFSRYPWVVALPAAGGIFASADDLATWVQALFHDQTVLSAESLDQMLDWTPFEIPRSYAAEYGLGTKRFSPELLDGEHAIGHTGNALFYSAASLYLPDYGVAIGIVHNSDFGEFTGVTMLPLIAEVVSVITDHLEPLPSE